MFLEKKIKEAAIKALTDPETKKAVVKLLEDPEVRKAANDFIKAQLRDLAGDR